MTCNFEQGDKAIIVWEVLTGQMLRAFPMATTTLAGGKKLLYGFLSVPEAATSNEHCIAV